MNESTSMQKSVKSTVGVKIKCTFCLVNEISLFSFSFNETIIFTTACKKTIVSSNYIKHRFFPIT